MLRHTHAARSLALTCARRVTSQLTRFSSFTQRCSIASLSLWLKLFDVVLHWLAWARSLCVLSVAASTCQPLVLRQAGCELPYFRSVAFNELQYSTSLCLTLKISSNSVCSSFTRFMHSEFQNACWTGLAGSLSPIL